MKTFNTFDSLKVLLHLIAKVIPTLVFPYKNKDMIRNYQLKAIKNLIHFAYNNIELYRIKYDAANIKPEDIKNLDDFSEIPLITKEEIINNYPDKVLSKNINLKDQIISLSSGSSGKIIKVVYNKDTLAQYILAGLRTYSMGLAWKPWYKQLSIYTSEHPLNKILKVYWLEFINTLEKTETITNKLINTNFDFLSCYPSVLKEIKRFMEEKKIKSPDLKAIFVNSETVSQTELTDLSTFFKCNVFDEYSSEELNRIAAQCKYKNYHIFEDLNYIEILDKEGKSVSNDEFGEVVGTNLVNFSMPLIRYKQDDFAAISSTRNCKCRRNFKIIKSIKGRANDYFILPSGKTLSSGFLLDLTYNFLLNNNDAIYDYCIIQDESKHITIEVIPGANFNQDTLNKIQNEFKSHIKEDIIIAAKAVNKLTKTLSGKKNPIICSIENKIVN